MLPVLTPLLCYGLLLSQQLPELTCVPELLKLNVPRERAVKEGQFVLGHEPLGLSRSGATVISGTVICTRAKTATSSYVGIPNYAILY